MFNCEVPGCTNQTSREPHVCTRHFMEGWGRLPKMRLPSAIAETEEDKPVLKTTKASKKK